ncbi:hypothetical protein LOTGIDRAFT_236433 [Lottia gigantea]|uniref:EF-hand domain-containing protein n=1 Tax=Lottia gigantea TaxID=225164 RepID=V3ZMV3_LOTGI|nr:hypothetical protein LOTGIDRAFT_236433 [Lottia gigantea]ESO83775.1 hypothetical protein LOTGIDRAFT_236433 [Lottia gigantea]
MYCVYFHKYDRLYCNVINRCILYIFTSMIGYIVTLLRQVFCIFSASMIGYIVTLLRHLFCIFSATSMIGYIVTLLRQVFLYIFSKYDRLYCNVITTSILYIFSSMIGYIVTLLAVLTVATAAPLDLKASFAKLDGNRDGQVTLAEFNATLSSLDTDHNGKIILREYIAGSAADKTLATRIFDYFDYDADGHIDADDLNVGFHQFDVNLDNGVSFAEYSAGYQAIVSLLLPATSKPIIG